MERSKKERIVRQPSLMESIIGILFLLVSIVIGNVIYGLDMEIWFVISTFLVGIIGIRCGYTWEDMRDAIYESIGSSASILIIMTGIGFIIGTWVYSGTVPVLIGWLVQLINPKYVLVLSFVFCGIVSAIIGTSSASLGTIGIIMLGVATVQGMSPGVAAAAVITGSFVGQSLSPLADMVNFNSSLTGNDPISGIKLLLPAESVGIIASIAAFLLIGLKAGANSFTSENMELLLNSINTSFNSSFIILLPIVVLFALIYLKIDTVPSLFFSGLVGMLVGKFYQGFTFKDGFAAGYSGFNVSMLNVPEGFEFAPEFLTMVTRGGMRSMTGFIISTILIMAYIGLLTKIGIANVLSKEFTKEIKKAGNAIALNTICTFFLTAATGSVLAPPVLAREMFGDAYERSGISRRNMVTSFQTASTMGALLVPWNCITVYAAGVVGIEPKKWIPYLVLIYVPIVVNIIFGYLGIGVIRLEDENANQSNVKVQTQNA